MRGKTGPRVVNDPHVDAIKRALRAKGHTLKSAAQARGMSVSAFTTMVNHGIARKPAQDTVDHLKALGIYHLVRKRIRAAG